MKKNKYLITVLILAFLIGAIHGARFFFGPRGKVTANQRMLNRSKGNPKASIWIAEYMDYQCPACRQTFSMLESYLTAYPSKIYLQVRFHPLRQHRYGLRSALYAECAAKQEKFWEFHAMLFENQKTWQDLPEAEQKFHEYARQTGLNVQKLDSCVDDPLTEETVMKENKESLALGVNQTPTLFVNGKMIAGFKEIKKELAELFPDFKLPPDLEGDNSH